MRFSIKDFFSQCDQIYRKQRIHSHLLKKCLTENLIFWAWVKTGTRTPGPDLRTLEPGTRDSPQSLKVRPGTPLKFKSGIPGLPSKFKSGTREPPSKFKSGTPSLFSNEFIFFSEYFIVFLSLCLF